MSLFNKMPKAQKDRLVSTTTITVMGTGMTIMGTTTLMGMTTNITPILMRIIRSGRNRFATASRPDRTSNADQWNPI